MKKVSVGITIGLMAITAAATFIITSNATLEMFNNKIKSVNEKQEFYSKLSEIDTYIRTHYVGDMDEGTLIEGMVGGYISGMGDSYAEYITAEEYQRRLNEQTGIVDGLGFTYAKENSGYIEITEVAPGSAADEAGLQAGDIITSVNNTDVIAFTGGYDEAVRLFSCSEGTRVKLTVKRTDED
ncbi:MAG: S41 family peptidase, partial [Huintestinicola sp.]